MNTTKITPQLLREKGFEERMMFGNIVYVKGKCALVYNHVWLPCTTDSGSPLSTNIYVNTWEEFEKLKNDAGIE